MIVRPHYRFIQLAVLAALLISFALPALRAADAPADVAALTQKLTSADVNESVAASEALRQLGPAALPAAPTLAGLLEHPLGWVRSAAVDALKAIGPESLPAIVQVFKTASPAARQRAGLLLGSFGAPARIALPALREALAAAPADQREGLQTIINAIENPETPTSATQATLPAAPAAPGEVTHMPYGNPAEWAQFQGPRRDLLSRETGLLDSWPAGGPKLLWMARGLGRGFSSVAIAGGKIFTMGDRADGTTESQFVIALDLATQKELWATRVGPTHLKEGPRCTPTIDGGLLYALGTEGDLVCLETATGKLRWRRNLVTDFGGKLMSGWKWSESPLVYESLVICTPGAPDAALVCLQKEFGHLVWKCAVPALGPKGKDGAAYSSVVAAKICGVPQFVQMIGRGVIGVEAVTGRFLWGYNAIANATANITHPLVAGDLVFAPNGYNMGSVLLKITRAGEAFQAEPVYALKARQFGNHHGGVVLSGGHVYGGVGDNAGAPTCLELATGAVKWQARAPEGGSATVLGADGHLIFRYDRFGLVTLVEMSPAGCKVKGSFHPPVGEGPAWAHMALHQGKLYLRHADLLLCYELKK